MKKKNKLKTEIREAIIRKAQESPESGCRKISAFILEEFNLPVSKSSVSTVLKSEGLNKPVGRHFARKKDTKSQVADHRLQVTSTEGHPRSEEGSLTIDTSTTLSASTSGVEKDTENQKIELLLLSSDKQPKLLIPAPEAAPETMLTQEPVQDIPPQTTDTSGVKKAPGNQETEILLHSRSVALAIGSQTTAFWPEEVSSTVDTSTTLSASTSGVKKALPIILPEPSLELASAISIEEELRPGVLVPNMGCWFLKAADLCLGGIEAISDIIISGEGSRKILQPIRGFQDGPSADSRRKDSPRAHLIALNETILYLPLFGIEAPQDLDALTSNALAIISGKKFSKSDIQSYLIHCEAIKKVSGQIFNQLFSCRTEVLGLKFILEDNSFFFLDAASHTIWSTGRIPKYFSRGLHKTKAYLQHSILENTQPLILQAPPGFAAPTQAFLNFIASFQLEKPDKAIKRIELYSLDNQLIETIQPVPPRKRYFIFGLWPWQYFSSLRSLAMTDNDNRKILDIITNLETEEHSRSVALPLLQQGQTTAFWPEGLSSTADASGVRKAPGNQEPEEHSRSEEVSSTADTSTTLSASTSGVRKAARNQKEEKHSDNAIIGHYLEHWPNLEIGYQDFLDKIGHFPLFSKSEITPKNNVHFPENRDLTLNELLNFWRWELNSYCQKHFFPLTYQGLDFLLLKERFYHLGGKVLSGANHIEVIFEPPQDFPHLQDLQYACQRVNESDLHLLDERKLRFEVK